LLAKRGDSFSFSRDKKVNYSRPSINAFVETVAAGGVAIVQDPKSAYAIEMPIAAINNIPTATILSLSWVVEFLLSINQK